MPIFNQFALQENHKNLNRMAPYLVMISLIMFMMAILTRDFLIVRVMHLILLAFSLIYLVLFKLIPANKWVIYSYLCLLYLWGIIRLLILPDIIVSHTPLISIIFALSFLVIYDHHESVIFYTIGYIILGIGLSQFENLQYTVLLITYLNIIVLSIIFTFVNRNTRYKLYEQTQELIKKDIQLNKDIVSKDNERLYLTEQIENVVNYGSSIFMNSYESENAFLSDLFNTAFKSSIHASSGAVYIIEDNQIRFIKTLGHNIDQLNKLSASKKAFDLLSEDIIIIHNSHRQIFNNKKVKLLSDLYGSNSLLLKESIAFQLSVKNNYTIGFILDISTLSSSQFDENTIRMMKTFQNLLKIYYLNSDFTLLQSRMKTEIIYSLINFLELHDQYTTGHSINVANHSKSIAIAMNMTSEKIDEIYWAGVLHDIGKLIIPESILNKRGKLSTDEYIQIKNHPLTASKVLSENPELNAISKIIHSHHERIDGKGYPDGLKGTSIPIEARIIAVADAYDAMISDRSYKTSKTVDEALIELKTCSGTQFDSQVVDTFISIINSEKAL